MKSRAESIHDYRLRSKPSTPVIDWNKKELPLSSIPLSVRKIIENDRGSLSRYERFCLMTGQYSMVQSSPTSMKIVFH
jgi:hypothetical protein